MAQFAPPSASTSHGSTLPASAHAPWRHASQNRNRSTVFSADRRAATWITSPVPPEFRQYTNQPATCPVAPRTSICRSPPHMALSANWAERTRPAQPGDRGALAAETLPEPPCGIVGVVRDAQLLRSREELTHQPVPDAPTVPGRNHELSRYGHADGLAPKQHATRHYADEPPPPPPLLPLHQRRGGCLDPRVVGEKPLKKNSHGGRPPALVFPGSPLTERHQ